LTLINTIMERKERKRSRKDLNKNKKEKVESNTLSIGERAKIHRERK